MRLRPASPYEASKAAADAIALSYRPAYGLPVAVTRFANIYGGGDLNFSRLIPEAVAAVLDGRRPQIRSDGSPERDFLYVDDAVAAYLAIEHAVGAGGPAAGEAFNAGGERPHSVAEVLETIAEVSGAGLDPEYHGTGNPTGEIDRQYVDSTKLRELTGWRPEVELARRPGPYPRVVPPAPGGAPLMCGRFTVTAKDTKTIADRFQVELEKALERGGDGEAPPPSQGAGGEAAKGAGALQRRADPGGPRRALLARPRGGGAGRARGAADALGPGAALGQGPQGRLPDDQRQSREPDSAAAPTRRWSASSATAA